MESGGKVLVHCSQGVSRSATFVIAYLMWKHDQPYDRTYQAVKAVRGVANPNIGFTCQVSTQFEHTIQKWGVLVEVVSYLMV